MSNNQLPVDVQERISKDADKFSYMGVFNGTPLRNDDKLKGYIAGATAEAERASVFINSLDDAISLLEYYGEDKCVAEIRTALQQWKEGKDAVK